MALLLPSAILVVLSTIISIYTKKTINKGIHPLVLLTFSSILVGLFLLPLFYTVPIPHIKIILIISLASISHFFAALLINKSLQISELSFITSFTSLAPIFGLFFAIIFFNDYPTFAGLIGVFIIVIGALALYKTENNLYSAKPIFFRIAGAMFIALSASIIKISLRNINYLTSTILFWFFLALFSTPILMFFIQHNKKHITAIKRNIVLLIVVSVLAVAISILTIYLYSKLRIGYVFAFLQLAIILQIILSKKMLGESRYSRRIIPAVIMILGMIMIFYWG